MNHPFRNISIILFYSLFLLAGCGQDSTEYKLDNSEFSRTHIEQLEKDTGLKFPSGTTGIHYHYFPPIDPIIFAKLKIKPNQRSALESQLPKTPPAGPSFPVGFANQSCKFWPPASKNILKSFKRISGSQYTEIHLVKEGNHLMLYLKVFTI